MSRSARHCEDQSMKIDRLVVCGSRDWRDRETIERWLSALLAALGEGGPPELIHGAARGADEIAGDVGAKLGFRVRAMPADWTRYGRRAGPLRNLAMLDCDPDLVIAFQIGRSRGTQHTVEEARRRAIRVEVCSR